jgi:hypothetical protein
VSTCQFERVIGMEWDFICIFVRRCFERKGKRKFEVSNVDLDLPVYNA